MDCLCCADGGAGPATDSEFLGSLCNLRGGEAKFPAEANRYTLYVVAGCPFAARPWSVLEYYGLTKAIEVKKCFPASEDAGWFFAAKSPGEVALEKLFPEAQVDTCPLGYHHLSQLYYQANPDFKGAISVPLLWDNTTNMAVSNSSLGLSEMIETQMNDLRTRNTQANLYPLRTKEPELYQEHDALVKMLHTRVTTPVYKMNATTCGKTHDEMVNGYYATLDELEERLRNNGPFLMGDTVRFADFILFISLVRLDLAYQWRFGLGRKCVRDNYPGLLLYQRRIQSIPGITSTILPRDIMGLYFLTRKFVHRTLPQVPLAWQDACEDDEECMARNKRLNSE